MPIRLPVTMNRRWVQMTALGAADVPDVKMSRPQRVGVGLRPGSAGGRRERRPTVAQARVGSSPSAKRVETSRLSALGG